jgi:hypothetical protein
MEDDLSWKSGAVPQKALSKDLIHSLLVQDRKDEGSVDLLSQTLVHADERMERLQRQCNSENRKILIDYLRIFKLEFLILIFGVSFPRRLVYIQGGKLSTSTSINNKVLNDVAPPTSTYGFKH